MSLTKGQVNRAGAAMARWWNDMDAYDQDFVIEQIAVIRRWREAHEDPLRATMPGLRDWVSQAGGTTPPAQRLKQTQTIIEKLGRHPGMKLARMQDIAGCRAVLESRSEVDDVAARIQHGWDVIRVADYRDAGRPDTGYRALHIMVEQRDRVVEIQLRTRTEHHWAEVVANTGLRLGCPLKDGGGPPELVDYFRTASLLVWLRDRGESADPETAVRFQELREAARPYFSTR